MTVCRRDTPSWRKNLWLCAIVSFIVSSGMSQFAPLLPLYIHELGVTDQAELARWSGIVYGCNFISLTLFSPLWGVLADKRGRKPMALRATLWLSVCFALMGLARNVHQLAGLRLAQGALSGFQGAIYPLVLSFAPEKRGGWAMSILLTGQFSGHLIGPLLGGCLAQAWGVRANFFIMSGCALSGFALLSLVREDFTPPVRAHAMWRDFIVTLDRPLILLFMSTFIVQFVFMSISPVMTILVRQLAPDSEYTAITAGAVFAAAGFASLLFAPWTGSFIDARGPARLLPLMLLCSALVCVPHAFARSAAELGLLRFTFGVTTAGIIPAIGSLLKMHARRDVLSRTFSVNFSHQSLGICIGSFAGGYIAAAFGVSRVFLLDAILLLGNALLVHMLFPKGTSPSRTGKARG